MTQKIALFHYVIESGFHVNDFLRQKSYILLNETDRKLSTSADNVKKPVSKERPSRERNMIEVPSDILHPELFKKLAEWRNAKAKETGMPAYVIMQQKALLGMVNLLPDDAEALEAIPYFGRKGVEKYGLELLGIIRRYMKEENLQRSDTKTMLVPSRKKEKKIPKKKVSNYSRKG